MKNLIAAGMLALVACGGAGKYSPATDPQDAGREFIRATLDGEHEKARFYLLKDTTNLLLLKQQESNYNQLSGKDKNEFRAASIRPVEIAKVSDSVTTYKYYNTFHNKDTTTIRIIKHNSEWLVDLKSIIKM
ncbi:MAG: hypothetical protein EOO02_14430 [Chitinophagaceae bacterium]|nr:MAG: hypothetical protein EOO02_14430 [Chitinophagaceae bacterium]